jgi:hypothetical protein
LFTLDVAATAGAVGRFCRTIRAVTPDQMVWHECHLLFPRRTIDGEWTGMTQTWRRRRADGVWEYRHDKPTTDDFYDRQY